MKGVLVLLFFALAMTVGAACFDYSLAAIFGKDIPWYGDVVAGMLLSQFAIPIALVCWVVTLCGVAQPFIG